MKFLKLRIAYLILLLGGAILFLNFYQIQQTQDLSTITLSKELVSRNEIEIKKLSNLKIMPEPKILENYVLNVNSCVLNDSLNNCVAIVKNISTNTHEDCLYLADEYKNEFMDLIEKGVDIKISCIKTNKDLAFDSSLDLQENLL